MEATEELLLFLGALRRVERVVLRGLRFAVAMRDPVFLTKTLIVRRIVMVTA